MVDLTEVYKLIESAEVQLRDRKFSESIETYRKSVEAIDKLETQHESVAVVGDVEQALTLLKKDLDRKIQEIKVLGKLSAQSSPTEISNTASQEPLMTYRLSGFQNNILAIVRGKTDPKSGVSASEIENSISKEVSQLFKSFAFIDQQKFKEYDNKVEQLVRENRKLTGQIAKLKERWDSLVESARQKRNQQNE
ncbi:LAQU0S08e01640g1_1 [Lachancea quebecensis]|uniref:LAQU0S08e01640g1_1 n=1 Tax=Lachancea quebecensis TaxID=1654605 RepID=A0A0P1KV75_9SACH|nr:LAQU0S08e01640g1_1 [Lachancea quebecensis]